LNNWLFNHEALAAERRVIALDLPGHGESGKLLARGDLDELSASVLALLDHLELEHAHLAGHSMGGAVALNCARLAPQHAGEGRLDAAGDLVGLHVEHLVAFLDVRAFFLEPGIHPALAHRQAPLGHGQRVDPAHAASLPSRAWRTAASIFAASGM
ncbi:hypothetical protein IPC878_07650, partial [Pseudomonas aeruginosa]|uniref:alpha/beta fold hydrolase n=1 Tax=Pseudomonas aeruginosa TaxID=287 RepID=UPI000FF12701